MQRGHNHNPTRALLRGLAAALVGMTLYASVAVCADEDQAGYEFFERRIRPMFVEQCGRCHGADLAEPKGGLRFDSQESLLIGGDRGPAIVPGDADHSLLLQSVRHDPEVDLKMPQGRDPLSKEAIADLAEWIDMGTPWPANTTVPSSSSEGEGSSEWAFQPVGNPPVPEVKDSQWAQTAVDRFILRRLEAEGLSPAAAADRRTLIRRATFDLTGLPPTPEEVAAFVADTSPDAYARLIDRLLSSPHYGERWARHWLDLVGYAETDGNEYDPDKPDAFRYRDYVIEALNIDLPYDQFLREHLAGDLLDEPRLTLDGSQLASPVATTFYWLGDVQNVPVDEAMAVANQVERQLDVIGKAFLGLTVACARCHDHKFDPISTEEYYGLAGFIYSSQRIHRSIDSPARLQAIEEHVTEMRALRQEIAALSGRAVVTTQREALGMTAEYLLAASPLLNDGETPAGADIERVALQQKLDPATLGRWCALLSKASTNRDPIFYPWVRLADQSPERIARRAEALGSSMANVTFPVPGEMPGQALFEDFERASYGNWKSIGPAFEGGPAHDAPATLQGVQGSGYASSGELSDVLTGRLLSDPVPVPKPFINILIAGGEFPSRACLNGIIFGQRLPELTATGDGTGRMRLVSFDVRNIIGREICFELVDEVRDPGGWIAVDQIFFSDEEPQMPDPQPNSAVAAFLTQPGLSNATELAQRYEDALVAALDKWLEDLESDPQAIGLDDDSQEQLRGFALSEENPLSTHGAADVASEEVRTNLVELQQRLERLERSFPHTATALIAAEGEPQDVPVHISGQPGNAGDIAPRGVPNCCDAEADVSESLAGSGRSFLADRIASAENPLTARVMVNRLWKYHFGQGLVGTPDNFGFQGELPSHPELLDYLATQFVESGWSLKAMHRLIMLSATYQQGNQVTSDAQQLDPANRLLHHMAPRRLEAECVRDAILLVSGNLNEQLYGPSVKLYITPYMEGRSLPEVSGPLDGDRRRSIYLELRRNHLPSMLTSFDLPKPATTAGRRATSALPTQALVMLNNEFVHQQAVAWAASLEQLPDDRAIRIRHLYEQALARAPDEDEQQWAAEFIASQLTRYQALEHSISNAEAMAWADLCHIMFNLAEFMYVR